MYVKLYEVYIWILVLGSRGKCKSAIHVNKILKKKKKKKKKIPVTAGDVIHVLHNYVYVHGLH